MFELKNYELFQGDSIDVLKTLPDGSVNCCVTSPPYYGLRDYGTGQWIGGDPNCPHYRTSKVSDSTTTGHSKMAEVGEAVGDAIYKTICPICGAVREDKQIGLEESPEEYIERLVEVFREVKRVLKDDGTLWVNIGDSYAGSGKGRNADGSANINTDSLQYNNMGTIVGELTKSNTGDAKPKDLIGIPWMLAFALRNDGWYLRQDIIWAKPNPMPESVKDRCTRSHEYIFLLSKSQRYYYDYESIQEDAIWKDDKRNGEGRIAYNGKRMAKGTLAQQSFVTISDKRNKRDVWSVPLHPYFGAHFATFPENLVEPCILAGCPEDGVVLDVFNGAGTTGVVSMRNNRKYIGIDLNQKFIDMTIDRFEKFEGVSGVVMPDGNIQKMKKEDLW